MCIFAKVFWVFLILILASIFMCIAANVVGRDPEQRADRDKVCQFFSKVAALMVAPIVTQLYFMW